MAAVDITDLIENLEGMLTIPGQVSPYDAATDAEWTIKLVNAFWRAVLDGVIEGYDIDEDGLITPTSGDTTFPREYQQVVILYAAVNIIQNQLLVLKTTFKAQAGSASYETGQAATVLTALLEMIQQDKSILLERLSDVGPDGSSYYYDSTWQRRDNQYEQTSAYWAGH